MPWTSRRARRSILVTGRGAVFRTLGIVKGAGSKPGSSPAWLAATGGKATDKAYSRRLDRRLFNSTNLLAGTTSALAFQRCPLAKRSSLELESERQLNGS